MHRAWIILKPSQEWGWFQKTNLHVQFEKNSLTTDDYGFRIWPQRASLNESETLVMGPSSAFGWGVDNQSHYSALIDSKIKFGKAFNIAGIGHTLVQGELLLNSLKPLKSEKLKNVIIAYGINELDNFRFFDQRQDDDITFFSSEKKYSGFNFFLLNTSIGKLISYTASELSIRFECGLKKIPQHRLTAEKYVQILYRLIAQHPHLNFTVIDTPYLLPNRYSANKTQALTDMSGYLEKSVAAHHAGNCTESIRQYKLARDLDPYRIERDVRIFNNILEQASRTKKFRLIKASKLLTRPELYADPVHPSAAGHKIISDALLSSDE